MKNDIMKKLKTDISIYQFKEEYDKNSKKIVTTIIKRIIIAIISMITVSSTVIFAYNYNSNDKIEIEEIDISKYITLKSLKNAVDNGYIENIDMEYKYSNGIGCKINSLIVSDNVMNVVMDFDFRDKIVTDRVYARCIIYDENKNVYCNFLALHSNAKDYKYQKKFYKKVGLSNELNTSVGYQQLQKNQNRAVSMISITSTSQIPVFKKLYINIYDVGYMDVLADKYIEILKNTDWNFSINIPEIFKSRSNKEFELLEDIKGFKLEKLYITDTLSTLNCEIDDDFEYNNIVIIDENGLKYPCYSFVRIGEKNGYGKYSCEFQLNKNMLTNKMFIQIRKYK